MTATVPWMSGLVNGLQNRLRRFESARHLITQSTLCWLRFLFIRAAKLFFHNYVIKPKSVRFKYRVIILKQMPMDFFTQEDTKPSEKTLSLIRQVAHTFRIKMRNSSLDLYCVN